MSFATPVFDGAHWDEEDDAGKHPTIQQIFSNLNPESTDPTYGEGGRLIGLNGKVTLRNGRTGETCPECGDVVREVSFADSSLQYCATCQTGGKPLADRRTSKFLK